MLCPKWAGSNSGQVRHLPVPPHTSRALRLSTAAVSQKSGDAQGMSAHINSATRPLAIRFTSRGEIITADAAQGQPARRRGRTSTLLCKGRETSEMWTPVPALSLWLPGARGRSHDSGSRAHRLPAS